jgi:hypothetical protein
VSQRARRLLGVETLSPWVVATLAGCASLAWPVYRCGRRFAFRGADDD